MADSTSFVAFVHKNRSCVEMATRDLGTHNGTTWTKPDREQRGLSHTVSMVVESTDSDPLAAAKLALNFVRNRDATVTTLRHYARYPAQHVTDEAGGGSLPPSDGTAPTVGDPQVIEQLAKMAGDILPGLIGAVGDLLKPKPVQRTTTAPPETFLHKATPYILGTLVLGIFSFGVYRALKG